MMTVTLPAAEEILITRVFDAPRHLVFRAWTTPDLVRRWWAGGRGEVTSVEIDLRAGGGWRYVMETEDGSEFAFHGEYVQVVPGERIVTTEVFEARPDARALTTVTFAETETKTNKRTTLSILVRYDSWWYDAAAFLALSDDRVWIELSGLPPSRLRTYYARHSWPRLTRKMIFGTDWPGIPGIAKNARAVAAICPDQETAARVLAGNAIQVYNLKLSA